MLPDRTILLNTYGCGLYHLTQLPDSPRLRNVYTFAVPPERLGACGIPILVGHYWLMPVGRLHALIALDITNPDAPVEVSRIVTDSAFSPHWLAKDPGSDRLILSFDRSRRRVPRSSSSIHQSPQRGSHGSGGDPD